MYCKRLADSHKICEIVDVNLVLSIISIILFFSILIFVNDYCLVSCQLVWLFRHSLSFAVLRPDGEKFTYFLDYFRICFTNIAMKYLR